MVLNSKLTAKKAEHQNCGKVSQKWHIKYWSRYYSTREAKAEMEGADDNEFPGFQILVPKEKDEYLKIKRSLSRLQRRAPCPLQLKPAAIVAGSSMQCSGAAKSTAYTTNSSAFPPSSFASCYHSKDPIPLLSPLVLPSLLEPGHHVQGETTATSSSFS